MCIFKGLQRDDSMSHDTLCLEDFYSFYEIQNLKWKQVIFNYCSDLLYYVSIFRLKVMDTQLLGMMSSLSEYDLFLPVIIIIN